MPKGRKKSAPNVAKASAQTLGTHAGALAPVQPGLVPAAAGRKRSSKPRQKRSKSAATQGEHASTPAAAAMVTDGTGAARSASPEQQDAPTTATEQQHTPAATMAPTAPADDTERPLHPHTPALPEPNEVADDEAPPPDLDRASDEMAPAIDPPPAGPLTEQQIGAMTVEATGLMDEPDRPKRASDLHALDCSRLRNKHRTWPVMGCAQHANLCFSGWLQQVGPSAACI
eukprot:COSAG02_NODE_15259_length_1188_cov_15.825528_1_plen_229_part_00